MITPEEDFETWKLIISTVTDDVSSFSSLFPDLQRLLRSIEQTGSLSGDLAPQTDNFIDMLYPSIINPLLNLGALEDEDILILIESLQAIVECCTSQISSKNTKFSEILENIFTQDQRQLYRTNSTFEVRESLINFFISIDGYQKSISAIEKEDENANKLGSIYNICLSCSTFLENYDSNELFDKTADAFCRVCEKDIRSFPVSVIDKIFDKITINSKWLSLFLILLRSDFFDKKLFSLQKISKIIENEKNKEILIDFFKNNLDEIISIPIHSEFGHHLGSIYGFAASNNLLNIEQIKNIWKTEEFVHPSILQSFYSIFEILSNKLPESESVEYANLIVETKNEPSQIWLHLISTVAKNFMNNKFSDSFEILRNKIWSLSFPTENDASNQLEKSAKKILIDLCKFNSQQLIDKILNSFSEIDDFCLEMIQAAASGTEKVEKGSSLLDLSISKLPNENAVKLISTLCIDKNVPLTQEQKDLIVNNPNKEKYLEKLIFDVGFDDNDIEKYFYSLKDINVETYTHIIKYVSNHNTFSEPLTSVPFMKEKLIWDFSLKQSQVSNKFQEYLCYHYSMNDGIILKDEEMINVFLSQLSSRFEISDKNLICKLLCEFIRTIEKNADVLSFDFKRHRFGRRDYTFSVTVGGIQQEFILKRSATVSVVLHKVAAVLRKPVEYINLFHRAHSVSPNSTLESLAERRADSMFFTYTIGQSPNKVPHLRTVLPTLIVHRSSHLMEKLFQTAKTSRFNFNLKFLLDILPTSKESYQQVMILKKVNSYDYEHNFPLEFPLIFSYNFEVLREKTDELKDHFKRTGGLSFFFKCLLKFNREDMIINELIEWIEKFIPKNDEEKLNDNDFLKLSNELFETLMRLNTASHHPDTTKRVLNLMTKLKPSLPQCDLSYTPKIIKFKKHQRGYFGPHQRRPNEEDEIKQASSVPLPDEKNNSFDDPPKTEPVLCEGNQFEPDSELMNFFAEFGKKVEDSIENIENGSIEGNNENSIPNQNQDQNQNQNENDEDNNDEKTSEVDVSIPFSHVLADSIPTFLFSGFDAIKNASQTIFENLVIPIEYLESILDLIEVGKTKPFLEVLEKQVKFKENQKTPTKLIDFSFNNLNTESKFWEFSLKMLNILIDFCTEEQKQKLSQFIKDNFFDLYRNDFESDIVKTGFEILGKLPQYLPECFEKIQNKQLDLSLFSSDSEYNVDGSDFRIERQTTGLANLGMTCFLNSILQQFFAIPQLRKTLIEYKGDDDFLIELRKLFCRMRESFSAWVSPKNVADHWVNWDGTKLNVRVQQDASEFVQMFVDKIALVVPQSMFNGTLVYHIDGINEEFHTSHSEPYSILSLQINESTNLNECFKSLKTPNFFNDYFADSLKKKIEAKQTEFIGNLPDHLIIQLKRFEFEYKTWIHKKINKRIDITESIDVFDLLDSNYIKNEFGINVPTKYNLNGVVLHMGSAQGGHYFSFVRNRSSGDWYKFNDKQVTPISIQEVITDSNGSNSNAYLLFYDRENLFEVDDSKLTEKLQTDIDQENKMSVMYRFFFTPSFTLLMNKILENSSINKDLVEIAIHYSMAIMCHLSPSIDCLPIYQQIQERIKDTTNEFFVDLILNNLHFPDFVCCLSSLIKERHFNFIYKPLVKRLASLCSSGLYLDQTKKVYNEVFDLFDKAIEKLDENILYFKLLYRLLKLIHKQNELLNKEEEKSLSEKIAKIFLNTIPQYLKDNPSIQPNYYYKSLNLGYLIKLYLLIEIPQSIIDKLNDPSFWTMIMSSNTKTKYLVSIYTKLKEMNQFDVESFIINEFIPKESMHVNMVVLFGAMFLLLHEKAIPLVWTTKFMIKDQFYVPSDVAFMFVLLCRNQIAEDVLVEKIEDWLPSILLHENYETRILAPFAVSFLIRHKSFLSLGSVPSKDPVVFDKEFFNVLRTENPCSIEMKQRIDIVKKCLLNKCINEVEPIIEKEINNALNGSFQPISKYRAVSLLNLLSCIKEITFSEDGKSEVPVFDADDELKINNFAEFIVNHSNICDSHIRGVAKIIDAKSCIGFLMKILPTHNCIPSDTGIINRIGDILDIMLPLADQIPPQYVLSEFIPSYVFTPISIFHKISMKFMASFCDFVPKEQILAAVDQNFEENCIRNLSAVLFVLQKFDVKRPVLKYAVRADASGTPLTLNEIIEFGFKFNEKTSRQEQRSKNSDTNNASEIKATTENANNSETSTVNENANNSETKTTTENVNNSEASTTEHENNSDTKTCAENDTNKGEACTGDGETKVGNESSTNNGDAKAGSENVAVSDGFDGDIISIVSLLNSNQLNKDVRCLAWAYLIENLDNLSLFTYHYKFEENIQFSLASDFINLSKLLKKFDKEDENGFIEKVIIPHLLQISKISFESFIENFEFLRNHEISYSAICNIEFVYVIFSLIFPYITSFVNSKEDKNKGNLIDISENISFINYCEIVFNAKNGIEKSALSSPLVKDLITAIYFDNIVLNDPVENAFTEAELIDSIVPIFKLLNRFDIQLDKEQTEKVNEFLEKIKSPNIQGILKLERIEVLINVIMKYLKI